MNDQLLHEARGLMSVNRSDSAFIDQLCESGWNLRTLDGPLSRRLSERAVLLSSSSEYRRGRARALLNIGWCGYYVDDYETAGANFAESRLIFERLGDRRGVADAINALGAVLKSAGRHAEAVAHHHEALELYEAAGAADKIPIIRMNLGTIYARSADYAAALEQFYDGLEATTAAPRHELIRPWLLHCFSEVFLRVEEFELADRHLREAIPFFRRAGSRRDLAMSLGNLGTAQFRLRNLEAARDYYGQSLDLSRAVEHFENQADVLSKLGEINLMLGRTASAESYFDETLATAKRINLTYLEGEILLNYGLSREKSGDLAGATDDLETALAIAGRLALKDLEQHVHAALARVYEKTGQIASALHHHKRFIAMRDEIFGFQSVRRLQRLIAAKEYRLAALPERRGAARAGRRRNDAPLPPRFQRRIDDVLRGHLEDKISVPELAKIAGLSMQYFVEQFKKTYGRTPHQYLLEKRLAHARNLLQSSRLPIAEIAYRAGFSSQAHLTTSFKLAYGVTPMRFRRGY